MTGPRLLGVLAVIAVAAGFGYAGFRAYRGPQGEQCYACRRTVHAHSRTVAIVRGHKRVFCCPACALSEHEQEDRPIQVTELTDFLSGAKLSPKTAFIVKGSDVNTCAHKPELIDADKRAQDLQFDRCSPSLLAFGRREDAAEFARLHGGEVLTFSDIVSSYAQ